MFLRRKRKNLKMSWIKQSLVFAGIAVLCALGTRLVVGEYDRSVPCDSASLEKYEVCMKTVTEDWKGDVLWIDARGAKKGKRLVEGALEISETSIDTDLGETAQRIFKAKNDGQKVVVFCQTDGCGSSKYVRGKILENMLHDEVYILFGGWKAYSANF